MRGANVYLYRKKVLTFRKRNSERPKFNISNKCHFSKQGQDFFTPAVCLPHLQLLCKQRVSYSEDYGNACITSPRQRQGPKLWYQEHLRLRQKWSANWRPLALKGKRKNIDQKTCLKAAKFVFSSVTKTHCKPFVSNHSYTQRPWFFRSTTRF